METFNQSMYDIFHITSLCIYHSMYDNFQNIYLPVYVKVFIINKFSYIDW